jgi:hypothetical protein
MAEIIPNTPLYIDYTLETGTSSPYPDFDGGEFYWRGERVFSNPADGGDGHNYKLLWWYYSSSTRPENSSAWEDIGTGEFEITSYETTVTVSGFPAWSSGSAVSGGATQYFEGRDYLALVDISSGDNTINPAAAVQSVDEDIAARWADAGPANAFRLIDDEVATATEHTGDWTITLRGSGAADRLSLWSATNIASVSVDVSAGEMLIDPEFVSGASEWVNGSASISQSIGSGALTVTNSAYLSADGAVYRNFSRLLVGRELRVAADVTCGVADEWRIRVSDVGSSAWQTGTGTLNYDFDVSEDSHAVYIELRLGTQDITVNAMSVKDNGYTPQTISKTLKDTTTGICRRNAVLPHNPVIGPKYEISVTATTALAKTALGRVAAGVARSVGIAEADVEVGGVSFSRASEDQYGTQRKIRRRRARSFRALVWLESGCAGSGTLAGDLLDQVLTELEGDDAVFDLNDDATDYSRLQLYGWAESWSTIVTGVSGMDTLSVQLRSLVETIRVED